MTGMKRSILLGTADGLYRGFLLFLLGELLVSDFAAESYKGCFAVMFCFVMITVFVFYRLLHHNGGHYAFFYMFSHIALILAGFLILCNYLEFGLMLFPRRELGNADGLLLLLCHGAYLLLSELLCLIVLIGKLFIKHTDR